MKCLECAGRSDAKDCPVCAGSGRANYVPYPERAWDEIAPGLFQGSARRECWDEFDRVFTLCGIQDAGPKPGVPHTRLLIPDGELFPEQFEQVMAVVNDVVAAVRANERVLVRCRAGLNRSGLVVALTLKQLGYGPNEAIRLIRAKRSPWALCNEHFARYVKTLP